MKTKRAAIHRKSGFRDPVFLLAVLVFYLGVMPVRAYAYLDPGTGSFIFQIIVGAVVGGIFFFKNFIAALKEKINRLLGRMPAAGPAGQTAGNENAAGASSITAADNRAIDGNKLIDSTDTAGSNNAVTGREKQP